MPPACSTQPIQSSETGTGSGGGLQVQRFKSSPVTITGVSPRPACGSGDNPKQPALSLAPPHNQCRCRTRQHARNALSSTRTAHWTPGFPEHGGGFHCGRLRKLASGESLTEPCATRKIPAPHQLKTHSLIVVRWSCPRLCTPQPKSDEPGSTVVHPQKSSTGKVQDSIAY